VFLKLCEKPDGKIKISKSVKSRNQLDVPRITVPIPSATTPKERLLSLNIDSDLNVIYTAFEPQCFNDQLDGKGSGLLMTYPFWSTDAPYNGTHAESRCGAIPTASSARSVDP
jgi:hypothetical protein